jgi:hypothetical protein
VVCVRALDEAVRIRSFVVGMAAIVAADLYLRVNGQRAAADWAACLVPTLLFLWVLGWHVYRRQVALRYVSVEQRVAVTRADAPDGSAIAREELGSLGFRQLAQIDTRLPWQPWQTQWIWRDRSGTVVAGVSGRPGVRLSTVWPDGAVVTSTNQAPRVNLSLPDVRQLGIRGEAARLYLGHRDAVAELSEAHGQPLEIDTAEALLEAFVLARPALRTASLHLLARPSARFTEIAVSALSIGLLALLILGNLSRS